jgi:hypothetical protein
MNYDKLSRSLRYYYEKGIMQKVGARGPKMGTGTMAVEGDKGGARRTFLRSL